MLTVVDKDTGETIPREKLSPKQREDLDRVNSEQERVRKEVTAGFEKKEGRKGLKGNKDED